MGKATDFKFGVLIDRQAYKPENAKVGQRGVAYFTLPILIILYPYKICQTAELANVKFAA